MSGRVFLFFPPRGHEPPPTLRDRLNPYLSLWRHRFLVLHYAERPDVALYAIGPLVLLPTPSSPHCALKVSEHDSLWQPPAAHSWLIGWAGKREQRGFVASRSGILEGTVSKHSPIFGKQTIPTRLIGQNVMFSKIFLPTEFFFCFFMAMDLSPPLLGGSVDRSIWASTIQYQLFRLEINVRVALKMIICTEYLIVRNSDVKIYCTPVSLDDCSCFGVPAWWLIIM